MKLLATIIFVLFTLFAFSASSKKGIGFRERVEALNQDIRVAIPCANKNCANRGSKVHRTTQPKFSSPRRAVRHDKEGRILFCLTPNGIKNKQAYRESTTLIILVGLSLLLLLLAAKFQIFLYLGFVFYSLATGLGYFLSKKDNSKGKNILAKTLFITAIFANIIGAIFASLGSTFHL